MAIYRNRGTYKYHRSRGLSPAFYAALAHWWKLDEANGTRADAVGGMTLTDNNTVLSDTMTFPGGRTATAAKFVAANNESLSHVNDASLQMGDIDWAGWGWFNVAALPAAVQGLFSKGNGGVNREYLLNIRGTAQSSALSFNLMDGGANVVSTVVSTGFAPTAGQSYFVFFWHAAASSKSYLQINNGTIYEANDSGVPGTTTQVFYLGTSEGSTTTDFGGLEAEWGMTKNYYPSAAERAYLYNSGNGRTYSGGQVV